MSTQLNSGSLRLDDLSPVSVAPTSQYTASFLYNKSGSLYFKSALAAGGGGGTEYNLTDADAHLRFYGDSGNDYMDLSTGSLAVEGGTNITTAVTAGTASVALNNEVHLTGDLYTAENLVASGTLAAAGIATFSNATDATVSTDGGTIISGGCGIAKKLFVGTALDVAGASALDGAVTMGAAATVATTLGVTGIATFSNATDATVSTDGGTIISGGCGIAKKLFVGTALDVSTTSALDGDVTMGAAASVATTLGVTGIATFTAQSVHSAGATFNSAGLAACGAIGGASTIGSTGAATLATGGNASSFGGSLSVTTISGSAASTGWSVNTGGLLTLAGAASTAYGLTLPNVASIGVVKAREFVTYSDATLKTNIKTIENPIEKVKAMRGVTYNMKNSIGNREVGFLAQELRNSVPEVVTGKGDGELGVDYGKLTSVLVEAVKAQQTQIEELKALLQKKNS